MKRDDGLKMIRRMRIEKMPFGRSNWEKEARCESTDATAWFR